MYSSTKCIIGYGLASQLLGKAVQTNYANWNNTQNKKPKKLNLTKPGSGTPFTPSGQETDWAYSVTTVPGINTGQKDAEHTKITSTIICNNSSYMCAYTVYNRGTTHNSSDILPSYPPHNYRSSNVVYQMGRDEVFWLIWLTLVTQVITPKVTFLAFLQPTAHYTGHRRSF